MSLGAFLRTMVRALDDAGIPHMLTGSLAAAYYSTPRATQDVDLVVEPQGAQLERLLEELVAAGIYVSPEAARGAMEHEGQFNAIDPETGWKADLIIRKGRPFSATEFARRRQVELLGVEIALTSLEDLIIAKLEWSEIGDSEQQRRDIEELLAVAGESLDRSYIERWVAALELEPALRRLRNRMDATAEEEDP